MIETIETGSPCVLGLKISGKLHEEDYRQFVPGWETILTEEGRLRLLVQFEDFHGWDPHTAWDDLNFHPKHVSDFERIAVVGDRNWEKLLTSFARPFAQADMKYFDRSEIDAARAWLREGQGGEQSVEQIGESTDKDFADEADLWSRVPWY